MLDPGDNELGKRVSFIFGDGQRNLATARATRIFYLWRRPAQIGEGPRNAYLLSLSTASATWLRPRNAYLLSLATASAIWRRPAQRVSFIFDDGQRNLATARAVC